MRLALAEAAVASYFEQRDLGEMVHLEQDHFGARHWRLADVVLLGSLYFDVREYTYFRAAIERSESKVVYSCKVLRVLRRVRRVEVKLMPDIAKERRDVANLQP